MLRSHQEMSAPKRISIWLGNFTSEEDFHEYFSEAFVADFGFEIHWPAGPEGAFEAETDIRSLLNSFSLSRLFIDSAVDLAATKGVHRATSALVFYNLQYDPGLIANSCASMHFIGVVPYATYG
jgi:hypothetical protein